MTFQDPVAPLLAALVDITKTHPKAAAEVHDQARRLQDRHEASIAAVEPMLITTAGMRLCNTIIDDSAAEAQTILACLS